MAVTAKESNTTEEKQVLSTGKAGRVLGIRPHLSMSLASGNSLSKK